MPRADADAERLSLRRFLLKSKYRKIRTVFGSFLVSGTAVALRLLLWHTGHRRNAADGVRQGQEWNSIPEFHSCESGKSHLNPKFSRLAYRKSEKLDFRFALPFQICHNLFGPK